MIMKMLAKDAIEMLKNRYDLDETIFIWDYGYDYFEIDRETGEEITKARWIDPDVDENCDEIGEMIEDRITILVRPE